MSWNYRVVRHIDPTGREYFGLHEVYYDEQGRIKAWDEKLEEVGNSLAELAGTIDRQKTAVILAIQGKENDRRVIDEAELPTGKETTSNDATNTDDAKNSH